MSIDAKQIAETNKKVGAVLKARRNQLGLSQEKLAAKLGITFQQLQKYEAGRNSLILPRAIDLCKHLGIGLGELWPNGTISVEGALPMTLAKNFNKLGEEKQKSVMALIRTLAKDEV